MACCSSGWTAAGVLRWGCSALGFGCCGFGGTICTAGVGDGGVRGLMGRTGACAWGLRSPRSLRLFCGLLCPPRCWVPPPPCPDFPWVGRCCPDIFEFCGLLTKIIVFFFLGASPAPASAGLAGFPVPFPAAFAASSFPGILTTSSFVGSFFFVSSSAGAREAAFSVPLFTFFPNAARTSSDADSSMELCAAFASIPFPCRKPNISLLCTSNSFASSCTFIFAMPSSISA